jgi:hypothetical protein
MGSNFYYPKRRAAGSSWFRWWRVDDHRSDAIEG